MNPEKVISAGNIEILKRYDLIHFYNLLEEQFDAEQHLGGSVL